MPLENFPQFSLRRGPIPKVLPLFSREFAVQSERAKASPKALESCL
jgi:hypothetical protein